MLSVAPSLFDEVFKSCAFGHLHSNLREGVEDFLQASLPFGGCADKVGAFLPAAGDDDFLALGGAVHQRGGLLLGFRYSHGNRILESIINIYEKTESAWQIVWMGEAMEIR